MGSSEPGPPPGYHARPATRDDLPAIDALYEASERSLGVLPESRASYLGWRWAQPYVDVARDARVLEGGAEVVGFSMVHDEALGGPLQSMARTHPAHLGRAIGTWCVERALWHARDRGVPAVRTAAPREDPSAHALFEAHGFVRSRSSFDMGVALSGAEVAGAPPPGVVIRPFVRGVDDRATWEVDNAAFRDHWDHVAELPFETWESEWFGDPDDPTTVLVAETDGRIVGDCAWVGVPTGAYVTSVAVLAAYRRRGIATALLRHAIADAVAAGHRDVYLSVDGESPTGAVGVYEGVGLRVRRTVDIFDRELR